jgi:hypothetical protein
MKNLEKELESIEKEYEILLNTNNKLKKTLNNKYDTDVNNILRNNKILVIENRYITVKNYNVNNINNEFEIENINLSNFSQNKWEKIIDNLKCKIEFLKKEIYILSENLY